MKMLVIKKSKLFSIFFVFLAFIMGISFLLVTKTATAFSAQKRQLPIYSVETDEKKIAISFDCAWGVDYTDTLLQIMESKGVVSTFFGVEFWVKKYPDYVKKIVEAGHDFGTHSSTHPYMSKLNKDAVMRELISSKLEIEKITKKTVTLFRPPYGDYNDLVIESAKNLGLYSIQWDVDSLDWKDLSKTEIENRVTSKVKNGSIVLFHNNGKNTSKALPKIIDTLKDRGYVFVKIADLIYKDNYGIDVTGRQYKILK